MDGLGVAIEKLRDRPTRRAAGLDTGTRSSDYIQLCSGDQDVLTESLEHIQKTASIILTELETAKVPEKVSRAP